jgi:hypothetical protein
MLIPSLAIKCIYGNHTASDAKAIPSILYLQMGLNNNTEDFYGYGWYDQSVQTIYEECGYSPEEAKKAGMEKITEYLNDFKSSPAYAVDFYKKKITSQWNTPMYQGFVMNNYIARDRTRMAEILYNDENARKIMDRYMNIYQLMIYGGSVICGIILFRKEKDIGKITGLIAVFGGFLFSVIWEAKARYVYPYLLIMIPYGIYGIYELSSLITRKLRK